MWKNFNIIISIALMFLAAGVRSQSPYTSGVSVKKLFLDYQSQNGGSLVNFKDYRHGFELGYQRNIGPNLGINIPFKYGVISDYGLDALHKYRTIAGLDAVIQYRFLTSDKMVNPYAFAGIGGVYELKYDFNVQAPLGAGLLFKITDQLHFNYQLEYRFSFSENRNNLHHGIGFVYMLGKPSDKEEAAGNDEDMKNMDSDGDGIMDNKDLCPKEAGPSEYNGCPDKDGDKVPDNQDSCPDVKGTKKFKGCPDTDNDGIADPDDACPDFAGTKENKGCPEKDSDGDGVPDKIDKCPDSRGLRVYNGCPDSDGDGIEDSRDKCPDVPGTVATGGCPEITKEDKDVLNSAMRSVNFETGKSELLSDSKLILNKIADILNKYSSYDMIISGHTDDDGDEVLNQKLSESRAKACYDYLISKGVSITRLEYIGYGESKPIVPNKSDAKFLNRRVEFNLITRK